MEAPALPPPPEPGKISRFFRWLGGLPRRFFRQPLPRLAAIITAIALVIVVATAWTIFLLDPESVPWRHVMTIYRVMSVLALLVAIPIVVYWGLRLWLEGDVSPYPEIDFAWNAGLTALRRNGIDIDAAPTFLLLGAGDERHEQRLMDATGLGFRVRGIPEGPAPLHWYANPDGVYLCCTDASWLSALASKEQTAAFDAVASMLPSAEAPVMVAAPMPQAEETFAAPRPAAPTPVVRRTPSARESTRGTIMLDQYVGAQQAPSQSFEDTAVAPISSRAENTGSRGTLMLGAGFTAAAAAPPPMQEAVPSFEPSAMPTRTLPPLAPQQSAERLQRLQYVCHLLRRERRPLCALNGVLTVLSFGLLQAGRREAEELERAVKSDLTTIQRTLQLRCPVTALVAGLEREQGFRELVRRVGRERAAVQRFGKGYDVRAVATVPEMMNLSSHVCGAFEDWIYTLFREQGALSRPGNTQLYSLLCKVRLYLKHRLSEVLGAGFGYDPAQQAGDQPVMFSGCYFASTGETEDRQAFVKGVFDKLVDEQEYVEWTQRALRSDRRYRWAAYIGLATAATLVIALVSMFVIRAWG
jgi:hypothetical protein